MTVRVELTKAQAEALVRLAECASNTYDDAMTVLLHPSRVSAGYVAIQKLNRAIYSDSKS